MPLNNDGTATCNRCGQPEASTSLLLFLIVTDLDEDGQQGTHYFCRRNRCSTAIRGVESGPPVTPQTDDEGTAADQTVSDGTRPSPVAPLDLAPTDLLEPSPPIDPDKSSPVGEHPPAPRLKKTRRQSRKASETK